MRLRGVDRRIQGTLNVAGRGMTLSGGLAGPSRGRTGLTFVELLITIVMVGGLISLMLPAVQAARESARRLECQSNIRQLTLGCLAFEHRYRHFPSGGWGWNWVGDPDLGHAAGQPGSWAYNVLPFIEAATIHQLPADGKPHVITPAQRRGAAEAISAVAPGFNCPSRRSALGFPVRRGLTNGDLPVTMLVVRSDYAINAGDGVSEGPRGSGLGEGPPGGALRFVDAYPWWWRRHARRPQDHFTGLSFVCSRVRAVDVGDGLSKTYLLGEKYLNPDAAATGRDPGDNENYLAGFNNDTSRSTRVPPLQDRSGFFAPERFGSPHSRAFSMALADGSVQSVAYDIDPAIHRAAGNRCDGR